jgi:hypothetical protein
MVKLHDSCSIYGTFSNKKTAEEAANRLNNNIGIKYIPIKLPYSKEWSNGKIISFSDIFKEV